MILHWYFARKFLWTTVLIFSIFVVLLALIDLVDKLQDFAALTFGEVLGIVLLKIPEDNYEILPLVIVLATVALYIRLARSSELVVVRAAGRSALRSLAAPMAVAAVIGVISITIFNPLVAASAKRYNDLINSYAGGGGSSILVIATEGLWLRQANDAGQTVIHAERASSDVSVLFDTTFMEFDAEGTPERRILAQAARLQDGEWLLYDVKVWALGRGNISEATAQQMDQLRIQSDLTQDRIVDSFGKPEYIPIWELREFITQLEQAGFSARRYDMWYQMELARPLFLMSLVMVAAAFTMRPTRLSNTGLSVLTAVLLGFGLHYVRNFAQILGENGEIPVALAAWAPPVAFFMLATGIVLHMEDG